MPESEPLNSSEPPAEKKPTEQIPTAAEGYPPQPPLTEAQIEEMNKRRYPKALSQEEIDNINSARDHGIHHGV
jgi:hypothetical protein